MSDVNRPLPSLDIPDTREFWQGTKHKELRYQQCATCSTIVFFPRAHCTGCTSSDLTLKVSAGRGHLYSYSLVRKSFHPFFEGLVPYAVAWVDLEEGPRILSNLTGIDDPFTDIHMGMPVTVEWEEHEGLCIPLFKPA